ncbi:hypothetical protein Efla_002829 [Eimeria flavescens]
MSSPGGGGSLEDSAQIEPEAHEDPAQIELQHADSPAHVPVSTQPPCHFPEGCSSTGRLLPGRQRILASAARQLAASEMLLEGLDICALDINTHALPPPNTSFGEVQDDSGATGSSVLHRRRALELLRLHALLQAAVGEEQDLVVVGLHQVATQHRHEWAACIAAAFAAAEGQALAAIRARLLGPHASAVADSASSGTPAPPPRAPSFSNYEQIVPLSAYPHHNQLLLVYVHPSHLHKVTLLSIAKSRLGSYCCRDLQQNYKQQWGFSAAEQRRLRQKWEQQQAEQQQQQRQQRMDLFFNFSFFGLSDSAPAADAVTSGSPQAEEQTRSVNDSLPEATPRGPLEPFGLSRRQTNRQQRINRQRHKDCICCSRVCSLSHKTRPQCSSAHAQSAADGNKRETEGEVRSSTSTAACGCEVYKEVFAYGGMAARLLIGATPVVIACIDLKLTEDALESCGGGLYCRFCHPLQHAGSATAEAATSTSASDGGHATSCTAASSETEEMSAMWRRRVTRALQRQQLLTILADIRFETDSGWASALELKPLLLLGARRQHGLPPPSAPLSASRSSVDGRGDEAQRAGSAASESCLHAASAEQQRRLKELEQLGMATVGENRFFYWRVPEKAGTHVLSLVESGRAAEWRRPAWTRRHGKPEAEVVARFWLRWMCCRLLVESVDADRVKTQCNELRRTLRQEGRCLSKLLVDPPLLQLPPVRPFEPMQLKICLSNPHESLPTAYRVYCLSDSGKSIVPLSYVSYWHGALWRRWEKVTAEDQSASPGRSNNTSAESQTSGASQQDPQQRGCLQDEQQRQLSAEAVQASASSSQTPSPSKIEFLRGAAALAVANEADSKAVLRKRIRLERWLLMDSLHGFLKGGETRIISMTLNIQEGLYSAQEIACGVLVLRLVDSRQDFFCCLAASLMPALLGAELQPLAMLGSRPLLPYAPQDASSHEQTQQNCEAADRDSTQLEGGSRQKGGSASVARADNGGAEDSQQSSSQLPLPKELWWLLMHIHAKTVAAASAPAAWGSEDWRGQFDQQKRGRPRKSASCERRRSRSAEWGPLHLGDSPTGVRSRGSLGSITSSGDSSQSEREDAGYSVFCQRTSLNNTHGLANLNKEGLGLNLAVFLCTAGGESLTWPSFLAGADTYLQPEERPCEQSAAPWTCEGLTSGSQGQADAKVNERESQKRCDTESRRRDNRTPTDEMLADSEFYVPLKRDVAFLRACLERGVAIPAGVPLCAALLLLEEWGATSCFFPSEFAVQDVQTDSLHLLCRAILLSLPSVHRNAFMSVVSAINELLQTAARSAMVELRGQPHRKADCCEGHSHARTNACGSVDFANAVGWVGCCSPEGGVAGSECSQMCLEVFQSGERGGPAQRVNCLESLHTLQLLRHAVLLWMGAWLMKSCRPALRHAVLDHFIAHV